jgi:hypothetical protein
MSPKPSSRFNRTALTEKVAPALIGLIFLGLVAVLVLVALNSAGVTGA